MGDENERYIKNLSDHRENALESARYSSDRFDILIVSISTTALVVSIGSIKGFLADAIAIDTRLIKVAWVFFVVTILCNLTSQLTAYYSHKTDARITKNMIRDERKKPMIGNQEKLEKRCRSLNSATQALNIASFVGLIIGIIMTVCFYAINI